MADRENTEPDTTSTSPLVTCADCGHSVPEGNMTMHQLRACSARARVQSNNSEVQDMEIDEEPTRKPADQSGPAETAAPEAPKSESTSRLRRTRNSQGDEFSTPQNGMRRRRRRLSDSVKQLPGVEVEETSSDSGKSEDSDDVIQVGDVVDLVSDDSPSTTEEWACPQCTLLNNKAASRCEACHLPNPNRPPDPTHSERLISSDGEEVSPLAVVGGGAIMGGLLGAAGSFIHGRSALSGAANGAVTGVVGGAFLNEVLRSPNVSSTASPNNNQSVAQARSSSSITGGYPSLAAQNTNRRARPRSSYRVSRHQGSNGTTTTVVTGGNGATRITRNHRSPFGLDDQMMGMLLHAYLQQSGAVAPNVDGMDYDELLQAFGDGTENLGADETQIQQLPTKIVDDPEKELPEDARQCLICLEEFAAGDNRKTLPCLHGFHVTCCDKWLRTNGSCPICKHKVN